MIISPIFPINSYKIHTKSKIDKPQFDSVQIENLYINKKPLVDKKIIKNSDNINVFFDNISSQIFDNKNTQKEFSTFLKYGFISLSSSCYNDIKNPQSAAAVELNENTNNTSYLDNYINKGIGIGINFSNFSDPISEIKNINSHFKKCENSLIRPPAGIALLNIDHPKINDFITLKNNADYNDWCFDLSVVIDDNFKNNETYNLLLDSMLKKGEPGVIFSNDKNYICDCCGASQLKKNENLTLGHINLARFKNNYTGQIDYNLLAKNASILNQAMKNIDNNAYIGIVGYGELIDNLNLSYGSDEALNILKNCLAIIKSTGAKMAISPTATVSKILNTTSGIEPKNMCSINSQLKTMAVAQKYLDGQISKTIILPENATTKDVDYILKYSKNNGIKGITVYKK